MVSDEVQKQKQAALNFSAHDFVGRIMKTHGNPANYHPPKARPTPEVKDPLEAAAKVEEWREAQIEQQKREADEAFVERVMAVQKKAEEERIREAQEKEEEERAIQERKQKADDAFAARVMAAREAEQARLQQSQQQKADEAAKKKQEEQEQANKENQEGKVDTEEEEEEEEEWLAHKKEADEAFAARVLAAQEEYAKQHIKQHLKQKADNELTTARVLADPNKAAAEEEDEEEARMHYLKEAHHDAVYGGKQYVSTKNVDDARIDALLQRIKPKNKFKNSKGIPMPKYTRSPLK